MEMLDVTLQKRKVVVEEVYVKPQYNWVYENSINSGKVIINLDTKQEFKYEKWRTNSSLSNHQDTILLANQMNINHHLSDKLHYHYLFYSVPKKTRYGKKKTEAEKKLDKELKKESEVISLIQSYYKYNIVRAKEAYKILTQDQIELIRQKQEKGGVK
jgi:hypothetical protein